MITQEEIRLTGLTKGSTGSTSGERFSVLLVEDDRSLRRYLEIVLKRAGYQVISAGDGLEAMKVALGSSVDIVVTDAMMPHLNGYELCRFLRNSPQLAHIPIILLSALERAEGSQETTRVDAFLAKPVSPEELLECLQRLLVREG